jgi:hypothetical protein
MCGEPKSIQSPLRGFAPSRESILNNQRAWTPGIYVTRSRKAAKKKLDSRFRGNDEMGISLEGSVG